MSIFDNLIKKVQDYKSDLGQEVRDYKSDIEQNVQDYMTERKYEKDDPPFKNPEDYRKYRQQNEHNKPGFFGKKNTPYYKMYTAQENPLYDRVIKMSPEEQKKRLYGALKRVGGEVGKDISRGEINKDEWKNSLNKNMEKYIEQLKEKGHIGNKTYDELFRYLNKDKNRVIPLPENNEFLSRVLRDGRMMLPENIREPILYHEATHAVDPELRSGKLDKEVEIPSTVTEIAASPEYLKSKEVAGKLPWQYRYIKKYGPDIENVPHNKGIESLMKMTNELRRNNLQDPYYKALSGISKFLRNTKKARDRGAVDQYSENLSNIQKFVEKLRGVKSNTADWSSPEHITNTSSYEEPPDYKLNPNELNRMYQQYLNYHTRND